MRALLARKPINPTRKFREIVLPPYLISWVLLLYLSSFSLVNAQNVLNGLRTKHDTNLYAEVESPGGISLALAAIGTLSFFVEAVVLVLLGFRGDTYGFLPSLQLHFQYDVFIQITGIVGIGSGVLVFIWSVLSRGRYTVSWAMPKDHVLVTWGPYRYVRHPSYLGYHMMVIGLLFTWLNLVAVVPLIAILGYISIVHVEEYLLVHRFGDEYLRYMERTGRFIPSFFRKKNSSRR